MEQSQNAEQHRASDYVDVSKALQTTFNTRAATYGPNLYKLPSKGLSNRFVDAFAEVDRKTNDCKTCRAFLRRYGHVAFIDEAGFVIPALWDSTAAPEGFEASFAVLEETLTRVSPQQEFFTNETTWGKFESGGFNHLCVQPSPAAPMFDNARRNDHTKLFRLLEKAVAEFPREVATRALQIINTDAIKKPGDFKSPMAWFVGFHGRLAKADGHPGRIRNLVMRELATMEAPVWARIANTILGKVLMADIKAGLHIDQITGRFNKRAAEGVYGVQTAAPTQGNVEVARKIFDELALDEKVLERRLARLDEIQYIWQPPVVTAEPVAVATPSKPLFGDIKTKDSQPAAPVVDQSILRAGPYSWDRFAAEILPHAKSIEIELGRGPELFLYYTAPVHDTEQRIFRYDRAEQRNPFCWSMPIHMANGAARAVKTVDDYGLRPGLQKAYGIAELPTTWYERDAQAMADFGLVVLLADAQCGPTSAAAGLGLHSTLLRSDLREARRTIEAANTAGMLQAEDGTTGLAVGIRIVGQAGHGYTLVVTDDVGRTAYVIDRLR